MRSSWTILSGESGGRYIKRDIFVDLVIEQLGELWSLNTKLIETLLTMSALFTQFPSLLPSPLGSPLPPLPGWPHISVSLSSLSDQHYGKSSDMVLVFAIMGGYPEATE